MVAQIRPNRLEVNDRFPMLGFTIRTDGTPQRAEVAIATDFALFRPEQKAGRTPSNFFSSRAAGTLSVPRGEAVYVVPPEVLARFIGADRLYVALATIPEHNGTAPRLDVLPGEGSPYVSLKGLTGRSLKRVRLLPSRQQRAAGYGSNAGAALQWAGDAAAPGMEQAPGAAVGAPRAAPPPDGGSGTGPIAYDDGFGPMPTSDKAGPTGTAPVGGDGGPKLATSQGYWQQAGVPARPYSKPFLVEPYDQPSSWWDALMTQLGHFAQGATWFLGVSDTRNPPYSAICQVRRLDGTEEGAHHGTAFFIAPRLLLTAAHVVDNQSELIIVPGKNGAGTGSSEPFGRFRVTQFQKHGSYGVNGSDNDMALICVPSDHAASAPHYFDLVEELTQSRPEGVVVSGYAAWWYATSAIEELVNNSIDENRQHAHGGYIRELPTDGTFTYDLQTLGGTSGAPVYWIEDGVQPRAHLVGVHVAANDNRTNLGCRITREKLGWIRATAAAWGQTLTFSLGVARGLEDAGATAAMQEDPDSIGISEDEPVEAAVTATAQAGHARAFDAPLPDYPGASRFVPAHANNYTPRRRGDRIVDRVVIHITAGGPSIDGTISWFQNGSRINERTGRPIRSSAHYIVGRDGEIVQMVRNAHTAHHASAANSRSIGIEHNANKPSRSNPRDLPPTEPQYEASARLAAWLCQQYGIPADREHIVGHYEISPGDNHDCPSSYWDWDHYMDLVRAAAVAAGSAQALSHTRWAPAGSRTFAGQSDDAEDAAHGIEGPIPDVPVAAAESFAYSRPLSEQPEYPQASRFAPAAPGNYRHATTSRAIDRIVIHITDGRANINGTISWFQNPSAQVSSHYVVGQDGEVVQMVLHNDVAWHAGRANGNSIGIEHVANTSGLVPTEAEYQASAALVAWLCGQFGVPLDRDHILGHAEADSRTTHTGCPNAVWDWEHYMDLVRAAATAAGYAQSLRSASAFGASARALTDQSFTLNWDEVQAIPQPTDVSCWAAAAAMVLGWKDLMSLAPDSIAQIAGRTTATGLDPAQVEQFAQEIGLVFEQPQCYTIEGFRRLLEANGPLWVGTAVPGLHAIVVTGMYHDGTNTFVRITDPWDRQVGTPGAPGTYLNTHSTGSRYIMRWEDFVREYEAAATDYSQVNLQILHSGGTGGRQPNYGSPSPPPGYAQSLAARAPAARPYHAARSASLPPPPRARSFNAPQGGGALPSCRRVRGGNAEVSWELDQYEGMKAPAGMIVSGAQVPTAGTTVNLSDWPYIDGPTGRTYAAVVIDWKHQGGLVGDVQIVVPVSMAHDGYALKVSADIGDGPDTAAVAALRINVRHEFSRQGEPSQTAVTEVTLYGDGRYERQNRWEPSTQAAA